jgi:hypothetical protein
VTIQDSIAAYITQDVGFDGLELDHATLRNQSTIPPEAIDLANNVAATFNSPQGRKTLQWMVRQFMLRPASADPHEALHKAGAHAVVYQILVELEVVRRGLYGNDSPTQED